MTRRGAIPGGIGSAPADPLRTERAAFERLLAELSLRFANVSHEAVESELDGALGRLVEQLGYDRCTYSELTVDGRFNVVCSAATNGEEPLPRGPFGAHVPWLVSEIRAGRVVALPNLPAGVPSRATADLARVREIGLRSHLSIPLRVGGRVVGALSFGGLRSARTWPDEVITRLTIIGELIAGAIARAQTEEELQRLRTRLWHADRVARIGALTAVIAHELNQPLTAILSNAQAGLADIDRGHARPDEVRAILEAIVRDEKRATETIRAMRALLRDDESGRTRLDVASALGAVLQLLAAELRRQSIRVETDFDAGCRVIADRIQIEQVVLNLILNGAAAMQGRPRGERVLRLSVNRTGEGKVCVAVADTGTGIAPENIDLVFEPFWTTRREGLGLGLAICRSIVQAHRGTLWAEPNPEGGATFRFALRQAGEEDRAPAGAYPATAAAPSPARSAPPGTMVCVVDDDPAVRESLVRVIAAAGWNAAAYASAREFLERGSLADIGCIVLDNRMPGMSGLELQAELAGRHLPPAVVFLTGHGDIATGVDVMRHGAVDFLEKPVEQTLLVAAVRKAMTRYEAERAQAVEQESSRSLIDRLTAREREVASLVVRGRLNKQIATALGIAEQTVKQHRARVMEKLGVRSVPGLVRIWESSRRFAGNAGKAGATSAL